MRGPGLTDFRLDVRESRAGWRIWNADEMVTRRTLDLPARVTRIALQGLVAVRAVELEFGGIHRKVAGIIRGTSAKGMKNNPGRHQQSVSSCN